MSHKPQARSLILSCLFLASAACVDAGDPSAAGEVATVEQPLIVVSAATVVGTGNQPTSTIGFVGPTTTVTLGAGQKVMITGNKTTASSTYAAGYFYTCMQSGATWQYAGFVSTGIPNYGTSITVHGILQAGTAGTYTIGMCAQLFSGTTSYNGAGSISYLILG